MTLTYKKVETSKDVYSYIWLRHANVLTVFGTISHPDGDPHGNPEQARMYTEWGFKEADAPLMAIDEQWAVCRDAPGQRNEHDVRYYLFIVQGGED